MLNDQEPNVFWFSRIILLHLIIVVVTVLMDEKHDGYLFSINCV